MLELPKIVVKDGKDTILTIDELKIPDGESLFLGSDNAVGKSTFLEAIYLYLQLGRRRREKYIKTGETYIWNIQKTRKFSGRRRYDALLLRHSPAIFPELTVYQNIRRPLKNLNIRMKNKIIDYLRLFDLQSKLDKKGENLSMSEKKIIELIRSVLLLPELLLIDDFDPRFFMKVSSSEPAVDEPGKVASSHDKVFELLELIRKNGTIIMAAGKIEYPFFMHRYTIKGGRVVVV